MALTKVNGNLIQTDTIPEVEALEQSAETIASIEGSTGFKNRIIGGNFSTNPWQRGTSFTGSTSAYTADRFVFNEFADAVTDVLKTADAPTVAEAGVFTQHCFHVDVTTADTSIGAAQGSNIYQAIEGYNVSDLGFGQSGTRYFTLSFWHKHTKTGTNCVAFRDASGNRSYIAEYTQSVSDTWEKAELTVPVDTSGTWDYTNGVGLYVFFSIAAGSDSQSTANSWLSGNYKATSNQVNNLDSTSNNFKIALVQLEAGEKATKFEHRSVGQERDLCLRYYERQRFSARGYVQGSTYSTGGSISWYPKRSTPTVSNLGSVTSYYNAYSGTQYGQMDIYSNAGGFFFAQGASADDTYVLGSLWEIFAEL